VIGYSLVRFRALTAVAAVALALLGGCATTGAGGGDPRDPYEPMNRAIYKFNDEFDKAIAKPVAEAYRAFVPDVVRTGVGNFFSNINDVLVALNNTLQGKIPDAINDLGRVAVNTTLGVLGFRDVATELGVPKNNEDFGQTLGRWGFRDGPYIVLPILGPSNVRDTFGWVGDIYTSPLVGVDNVNLRNSLIGLRFVTVRADLLEASAILETAALDPYEFVRDAYLQRRRNLVHDGNPPEDKDLDLKPEAAREKKPEAKPSAKPEAKPDTKPEPGSEPKPATKPLSEIPGAPDHSASVGGSSLDPAFSLQMDRAPVEGPKSRRVVRIWLPEVR
jgi:phospholipid-binding lipoprotein MlaA